MKPKFKNELAWERAQLLMQPAFIRVVDNLRKELEESCWTGTYQEVEVPYPSYYLCLSHQDRSLAIDLWQICFQICFIDYQVKFIDGNQEELNSSKEVDIDNTLFDENGEVDWQKLDEKTQEVISDLFSSI
jgi:hypothetical protein